MPVPVHGCGNVPADYPAALGQSAGHFARSAGVCRRGWRSGFPGLHRGLTQGLAGVDCASLAGGSRVEVWRLSWADGGLPVVAGRAGATPSCTPGPGRGWAVDVRGEVQRE